MYYNTKINYDMGTVTCTIILKSIMIWVWCYMYYNTKINYDMGIVTCTIILKSIMIWVLLHVL